MHIQSASWQYFWRVTRFALQEARDADIRTVVRWDGGEAKVVPPTPVARDRTKGGEAGMTAVG